MPPQKVFSLIVDVPMFETERLRFRGHCSEDLSDCVAMWSDADVIRFVRDRPFTEEETWWRMLVYAGHWALRAYGFWVISDKENRFVGEVGFGDFKRTIDAPVDGPELGFALASSWHGKGLATEAVTAAHAWLAKHHGGMKTWCMIDPAHAASMRVVEKCGYRKLRSTTYRGSSMLVFERAS